MFSYRSVRDGLVRALCVGCYSATSLIEKAGHTVFWPRGSEAEPGHAGGAALFEDGRR
ncbi:hypothetical protein OG896_24930 [Streptomyces sp. NBC_00669]|uniref:hypothetical protein n=1 Tax=Streptomyces sp. NBC_00669 TaxID=2976011 RepID=UPI002E314EDB|nr:hypothetical protein [Streptomyces sp. NBC_00669]